MSFWCFTDSRSAIPSLPAAQSVPLRRSVSEMVWIAIADQGLDKKREIVKKIIFSYNKSEYDFGRN